MAKIVQVAIHLIRTDGGTQPRADGLDQVMAAEYVEALEGGAVFPPVSIFYDGATHWLADGFHRLAAHVAAGRESIAAHVTEGTRRDAVLASCAANATHGKQRTRADKRRAVLTMLADPEWSALSDREVARRCSVSHPFVAKLRVEPATAEAGNVSRRADDAAAEAALEREFGHLRAPFFGHGPEHEPGGRFVVVYESEDHPGFYQVVDTDGTGSCVYTKREVPRDWVAENLSKRGVAPGSLEWHEVEPAEPLLVLFQTMVAAWRLEDEPWRRGGKPPAELVAEVASIEAVAP